MQEQRLERVYSSELRCRRGFSLDQTGSVYSFGWAYSPGVVRLGLCPGAVAEARQAAGEQGCRLEVSVYALPGERCWETRVEGVAERLGAFEDYMAFHSAVRGDPLAGCIPVQLPGWRLRSPTPWEALLVAVAQQNTGFRQGWRMLYKLHLEAGRRLLGPGWVYIEAPRPSPLLYEAARRSGWGYRAGTLARLAALASETGVEEPRLVEEAARIRGVGPYTVALARLLALRDYSSLPMDRWLRGLAVEAYSVEPRLAGAEIRRRFPGYEGLAALAATICYDAEPLRRALARLHGQGPRAGLTSPSPLDLWRHTPPG